MKKIYAGIIISLSLLSCSTDSPDNSEEPSKETGKEFLKVTEMKGGDDAAFYYENGLLVKGVGNSSSIHDDYYTGFQVEYGADGKVKKVFVTDYGPFSKPTDFTFDLKSGDYSGIEVYNYHFESSRLSTITNEGGKVVLELKYDGQGRVVEETRSDYDSNDFENIKYVYNSNGKLESHVTYWFDHSNSNGTLSGGISDDGKINPFYPLWKETGLIIPINVSGLTAYNVPYYPHNITEVYEDGELDFKAQLTYNGDYPVYYKELMSDIDGVAIEYLEE